MNANATIQEPHRHDALLAFVAGALGHRDRAIEHASADAGARRYWRVRDGDRTLVVMDAPPGQNDLAPFLAIDALLADAGLVVPQIIAHDAKHGFLLLSDLGPHTMLQSIDAGADPEPLFDAAIDALVAMQRLAVPDWLPRYDAALLERELDLFPDWYLERHRGIRLEGERLAVWREARARLVEAALAQPQVFVHRDYMPRNLMPMSTPAEGRPHSLARAAGEGGPLATRERWVRADPDADATVPAEGRPHSLARAAGEGEPLAPRERWVRAGAAGDATRIGILDFQDAVLGPIAYDPLSLVKDAFRSWPEARARNWLETYRTRAQAAGLPVPERDRFLRDADWIGIQRHLKVIGIFARLCHRDGKPHYVEDAPRFFAYLDAVLPRYPEFAALAALLREVAPETAAA